MRYEGPLCGECSADAAVVQITIYRGDSLREQRILCARCARSFEKLTFSSRIDAGLVPLVVHIAEQHAERAGASIRQGCPVCGLSPRDVAERMVPGCAACYTRFAAELGQAIPGVQASAHHRGKTPIAAAGGASRPI